MHDAPDAWHTHTADERPQPAHTEIANAPLILGVGIGSFLMVVATVAIIYWYYVGYTVDLLNEQELIGLEKEQLGRHAAIRTELEGYTWAKEADLAVPNTIQIPLEAATRKVINAYSQQK